MAQKHSGHLTIEQLSAFLDKQLFPEEEAACEAHLRICSQCQNALADLRQTSALLHALPQPELPHSFVLPAHASGQSSASAPQADRPRFIEGSPQHAGARVYSPALRSEAPSTVTPLRRQRRPTFGTYFQRSARILSTLAAVLGIIFILSGFLASLPHEGRATTSAGAPASSSQSQATHTAAVPAATPRLQNVTPRPTPNAANACNRQNSQNPCGAQTSGTSRSPAGTLQNHNPGITIPPLIDLNAPGGRAELGAILLILGILGVLLTRRRRNRRQVT